MLIAYIIFAIICLEFIVRIILIAEVFIIRKSFFGKLATKESFSFEFTSSFNVLERLGDAHNFIAAPDLVLVEENTVIIGLLTFVIVVFFTGLIFFAAWDFREQSWAKANKNKKPLPKKKSILYEDGEADDVSEMGKS